MQQETKNVILKIMQNIVMHLQQFMHIISSYSQQAVRISQQGICLLRSTNSFLELKMNVLR